MGDKALVVLLIEDSAADARLVMAKLRSAFAGVVVDHQSSLGAGLTRLAQGRFDVVLLDLGLAGCVGLDACRAIVDAAADPPILVVTGLDDETTAEEAVGMGAQDYLIKDDVTPQSLRRAITFSVQRKRVLVEATGPPGHAAGFSPHGDSSLWLG